MKTNMKAYLAFTKKELTENLRTYKFFILMAIFVLIGLMSPLFAKVMPQVLKSVMPAGMSITLAEPTAFDSWAQFFKNVTQMGMIVLVIIFSGITSGEFTRGTLVNMLTKGLSRPTVIFSKFTAASAIWTVDFIVCAGITQLYTLYFWGSDKPVHLVFSLFCLWLYGILILSMVIFGGILFKNFYGSLLLTAGLVGGLMLLNIAPKLQKFNPATLSTDNMALLTSDKAAAYFIPALIACTVGIIVLMISSIMVFNKKQV